jgi:polysaccharide biosynthesis/export protein VpsN
MSESHLLAMSSLLPVHRLSRRAVLGACLSLLGCAGPQRRASAQLPTPVESTSIGPGDLFIVEIVGEKDLPKEYQVASDGSIDFPYLHSVQVVGLEPQEIARLLREKLIEANVLTDPSVIVQVKDYRSKRVTILGQVQRPGSFPFQVGLTLVQAVSQAGGLNPIAVHDRIRVTRLGRDGKSITVLVDFEAISSGAAEDILLQAGDRIFVDERVF